MGREPVDRPLGTLMKRKGLLRRVLLGLPMAGVACLGLAGEALALRSAVPVDPNRIPVVRPDAYRPVDGAGNPIGPWRAMPALPAEREAPVWVAAWDSTGTRLTDFAAWTDPYGATAGPHTLPPNTYKSFMQANDVTLAIGRARGIASRVRVGVLWNPSGSATPQGTLDLVVRVTTTLTNDADPLAMGPAYTGALSGYEFLRRNQAAGPLLLDANLAGLGTGLPLPNSEGGTWVVFGSADAGGNFVRLQGVASAQPLLANLAAPGEPQFPGNNPVRSSEYLWSDEGDATQSSSVNRPDYVFQDFTNNANAFWAEQFSYDFTLENKGILQNALGLFVDTNTPLLVGRLNFTGRVDGAPIPGSATFVLRNPVGGAERGRFTVALGPTGVFQLPDPMVAGGATRIYVKVGTFLTEALTVTTSGSGQSGFVLNLRNGDIDGDDAVTVFDYDKLSQYFDRTSADADWTAADGDGVAPFQADLDGDGSVTVFDYDLLSQNFDELGAP